MVSQRPVAAVYSGPRTLHRKLIVICKFKRSDSPLQNKQRILFSPNSASCDEHPSLSTCTMLIVKPVGLAVAMTKGKAPAPVLGAQGGSQSLLGNQNYNEGTQSLCAPSRPLFFSRKSVIETFTI